MNKIMFCLLLFYMASCTLPDHSTEVLEQAGYTNIKIAGWGGVEYGCMYTTVFIAMSPNSKVVSGIVCCDRHKNCIIKLGYGGGAGMPTTKYGPGI